MRFDQPCTQQEFGELLGITQQAVSGLMSAGVLIPGDTLKGWLQKYTANLREKAAGRDSELAKQRALDTAASRRLKEFALGEKEKRLIDVGVIEVVLASIGSKVSAKLESLPENLHRVCPGLTPEALALASAQVSEACDIACKASLAMLNEPEEGEEPDGSDGAESAAKDGVSE